ncbi:transmembrane protein 186 isoform X2 [Drosophila eugracilis]|uniref:transmembrane protein 186 isoform X1 n=1 Tax=Drosophila eugracilis TaxID=29029 RepID=UPI0007E5C2C0|nr:transmembrane protein 186 isoform X1 [Drosophila eugracilis]XP_017077117.1 transmembrane protein 186 isoform X2 [Drosophila eugracilis]
MLELVCRICPVRLPWKSCMSLAIHPIQRRRLVTDTAGKSKAHDNEGFTEWRILYRLPAIRVVAAMSKLKIYQAVLTVAGTPIVFGLGSSGQISTDALAIYGAVGISGLVTLTLASYFASNLVGLVYVNEEQNLIKLAYVDFWGRRKEALVDTGDLLPSWEQGSPSRLRFISPICLRSDPKKRYKLLNRFGQVSDPQLFEGLFGD